MLEQYVFILILVGISLIGVMGGITSKNTKYGYMALLGCAVVSVCSLVVLIKNDHKFKLSDSQYQKILKTKGMTENEKYKQMVDEKSAKGYMTLKEYMELKTEYFNSEK